MKSFLALDLIAIGTPMLSMGDEFRRTQGGNDNPYGLDDETSWVDGRLLERHADVQRFTRLLIAARQGTRVDDELSLNQTLRQMRIEWHGVRLRHPEWSPTSRSLAATIWSRAGEHVLHCLFNAWREPLEFEVPAAPDETAGGWRRWVDTALPVPDDLRPLPEAPRHAARTWRAALHSLVGLVARIGANDQPHAPPRAATR